MAAAKFLDQILMSMTAVGLKRFYAISSTSALSNGKWQNITLPTSVAPTLILAN
jgi:hypothetical protein